MSGWLWKLRLTSANVEVEVEAELGNTEFLWFGHEPSWSRYLGWSVGWLVGLSVSTQISKQAITLPNHIPACRSEFLCEVNL